MDIDADLLFNFIPIISTTLCAIVSCITIYSKLKIRWPVKVNCWFCNCNSKVQGGEVDWWFCSKCEQYNGFNKDGNYKYSIPEQYQSSSKNITRYGASFETPSKTNKNGLCNKCNRNEELRLRESRQYENSINIDNKKEFETFQQRINNKFPLCKNCESTVLSTLQKQAVWLAQYKMSFFRQKPILAIIKNGRQFSNVLRVLLVLLACAAICCMEIWYFPICGILLQLVAYLASPMETKRSLILPILGWICLSCLAIFHSTPFYIQLLNFSPENDWISFAYYQCIVMIAASVGLSNVTQRPHKTVCNGDLSFKKLESPKWSISDSRSPTPSFATDTSNEISYTEERPSSLYSPVNITDTLMAPEAIETPIPIKPTEFSQMSFEKQQNLSFNQSSLNLSLKKSPFDSFSNLSNKAGNFSLNDSLTSLSSLSLDNLEYSPSRPQTPKIFQTRMYGASTPDLFLKSYRTPTRRSILAPPKLMSVAQSSWVAGGYWQVGMEVPTLSRSSSQSSGIGSIGSNLGLSREPSLYEFDRCSVTSKRPPCQFTRPESCASVKSSVTQHYVSPKPVNLNQSVHVEHPQNAITNVPGFSGHVTVITSPPWLPAVLCGSLVVNMLVLCAIMLR